MNLLAWLRHANHAAKSHFGPVSGTYRDHASSYRVHCVVVASSRHQGLRRTGLVTLDRQRRHLGGSLVILPRSGPAALESWLRCQSFWFPRLRVPGLEHLPHECKGEPCTRSWSCRSMLPILIPTPCPTHIALLAAATRRGIPSCRDNNLQHVGQALQPESHWKRYHSTTTDLISLAD